MRGTDDPLDMGASEIGGERTQKARGKGTKRGERNLRKKGELQRREKIFKIVTIEEGVQTLCWGLKWETRKATHGCNCKREETPNKALKPGEKKDEKPRNTGTKSKTGKAC